MNKHTASLMTAAMLLTMAWMTGCDSKELEQPAGSTTAPALETTAEPVTEAAETTAAEVQQQSFDSYDAFAAAMAEQHPELTLYAPPESAQEQWEWKTIQMAENTYQYELYNAEKQETVSILMEIQPTFQDAQEIVDSMSQISGVTVTLLDAGCCLCQWEETGVSALYGITGDMGCNYAATLEHDDGSAASAEELTALRSEFWL